MMLQGYIVAPFTEDNGRIKNTQSKIAIIENTWSTFYREGCTTPIHFRVL